MSNILCIGAHPDDMEFSCTGTLIKLKQQGYRIFYIIVTNGENGFKSDSRTPVAQRIRIRKTEQLEAARKLGVEKVTFLGYRDGFFQYTEKLRAQLVRHIKTIKPELVFTFDPANRSFSSLNALHRDHRIVGEAVFDACFAAKNKWMYPGEPHRVNKIFFFVADQPDHFEDITGLIDFKLELLACHRSQFPDFSKIADFIRNEVSKHTDRYEYSEAFRVVEVRQMT